MLLKQQAEIFHTFSNADAKRKRCKHTNCSVHHLRYCDGVQVFQYKMANQSSQLDTHQSFDTTSFKAMRGKLHVENLCVTRDRYLEAC